MKEYVRKEPSFSLCGLNCALCPRFHTEGSSRCPGCGGPDFALKHPTCAVVTCNRKHDNVEFCYQCSAYPCKRYSEPGTADSFISYKTRLQDMKDAEQNLHEYLSTLRRKQDILEDLIANYNDGKSKGFYCLAVNLLPLDALNEIMNAVKGSGDKEETDSRANAKPVVAMMKSKALEMHIALKLRK